MYGTDHDALLTRVRKTRAAVQDGDRTRVQREAANLVTALGTHLIEEAALLTRIPERQADGVHEGQRQLHEAVQLLAASSEAIDLGECGRIAARVEAMLTVQMVLEHRLLVHLELATGERGEGREVLAHTGAV